MKTQIKEAFPTSSILFSTSAFNELNVQKTINRFNLQEENGWKYVSMITKN